jgi:hypothetical protein
MAYGIVQADPDRVVSFVLPAKPETPGSSWAQWHLQLKWTRGGTLLTCSAEFVLRTRYLVLFRVLDLMKRAIHSDLTGLKKALENE